MSVMTYDTLVAGKTTVGSIQYWINYARIDSDTVLTEAQATIFQRLRVREMRTLDSSITVNAGDFAKPLPANVLEVRGARTVMDNLAYGLRSPADVLGRRQFSPSTGTLPANPFTATNGSASVAVNHPNHALVPGALVGYAGVTPFNGVNLNSTFAVASVTDANHYVIIAPNQANASGAGGGAPSFFSSVLVAGPPQYFAIFDEQLQFEATFTATSALQLLCFKSPALLSSALSSNPNPTNFLTTRFPHILRVACLAQAADFMRNDTEYQKQMTKLEALIEATNAEADMTDRMATYDTTMS
jgi:hypothetical protein